MNQDTQSCVSGQEMHAGTPVCYHRCLQINIYGVVDVTSQVVDFSLS